MKLVRLVHWKPDEAPPRIAALRAAGYRVAFDPFDPPRLLKELRGRPPDAVVIDLDRLPSHGRDVGVWLRTTKATRRVPIVFAGGAPDKVMRARQSLPDAVFTPWSRIRTALRRGIAHPPAEPVVPASALAAYSGTPLPRKLGIREGSTVGLLGAPPGFPATLGDLPAGARLRIPARGRSDLTVWFVRSLRDLRGGIARVARRTEDGPLWIAWPKQSSGVAADLTQPAVRAAGLAHGLVDYKICAIDATWSGLLFRRRKR